MRENTSLADLLEIEKNLKKQLQKVKQAQITKRGCNRFILILSDEQARFLAWKAEKLGSHKSVVIRSLLDKDMRKSKYVDENIQST